MEGWRERRKDLVMRHCVLPHFTEFSPSVPIVSPGYVRQDGAWRWVLAD